MNTEPLPPALPVGFGRAAEKLADTVRHVVDMVAGPDRLRARAQAQADSAVIAAEGRTRVQEVEARAVERLRKRESRRQRNIESITIKALEALPPPDQVAEQPVSEDWTTRFFEECQDISDEQMQQIWARIMAGEVARPGSFSPRTLGIVRDLTKQDATHFANLCRFVWVIPGAGFAAVIHDHERPEIAEADINFVRLMHLTSIGLIEFNNVIGFKIKTPLRQITVSYCGRIHQLKSVDDKERIFDLGQVLFTAVGRELAKVANASGNEHYRGATLETWAKAGWTEASDG